MSGMFYSLEEAAQKLNKSEDELKQLIKDGQIREFRDGPNILLKAEEVEALIPGDDVSGPSDEALDINDETEIIEMPIEESEPELEDDDMSIPEMDTEEPEPQAQEDEDLPELDIEEPQIAEEEMEIPELSSQESSEEIIDEEPLELALEPEEEKKPAEDDDYFDFNADTAMAEVPEDASSPKDDEPGDSFDNILLAPETGAPISDNDLADLTSGDTALVGQGTSILGQSDNKEYDLTDDTMADTVILDGTKGGSGPAGLDETEEDLSLDSFGSGSGLLDLSLQADDTSLGGILDEIYTDESSEPALAEPSEPELDAGIGAEPEVPAGIGDEALAPQVDAASAIAAMGAPQVAPDSQSNILGMLLFIPSVAVLYAAIVTFAGIRGILPSILTMMQDFIWFIMGGLVALTAIIAVAAFMLTGEKKSPVKKEKKVKVKKEKAPKVKKEKAPKPKKEKKPKPPKKEKKKK